MSDTPPPIDPAAARALMAAPAPDSIGARVRAARRAQGWTQKNLAREIGIKQASVHAIESDETRRSKHLPRIAEALAVDLIWLEHGDAALSRDIAAVAAGAALPPRGTMPLDVPVYGTAAGSLGHGSFQLVPGEVVDRVRRPPGIRHAADVYALFVAGDSMAPRFMAGELVYVSAKRPPGIGDDVVVQVDNGDPTAPQAYIKRLKKRDAGRLVLEQHNPPATIEIPARRLIAVHRVLTTNDLFGI